MLVLFLQTTFLNLYILLEKVQSEIDQVIGQTRQPVMDDRIHLPYTYAVIHEIQRVANIITITPPRVANKDIRVAGHLIPKVCTMLRMHFIAFVGLKVIVVNIFSDRVW